MCPLMERDWNGALDVTTPIGFSGFATTPGGPPPWFSARWVAALAEKGAVCAYLAQHPLFAPPWPGCEESAAGTLFVIDLDRSPDDWLQHVDANRRRSIRAWQRSGSPWVRDRAVLTEFVVKHHAEFMRLVRRLLPVS